MQIRDATQFAKFGDWPQYFQRVHVVYESGMLSEGQVDSDKLRTSVAGHETDMVVLDLEDHIHWWKDESADAERINTTNRLLDEIRIAREAGCIHLGVFTGIPKAYDLLTKSRDIAKWWQRTVDYRMPVFDRVDFVCTTAYVHTENMNLWKAHMGAMLVQYRRANKPIYPFLWHRGAGQLGERKLSLVEYREVLSFLYDIPAIKGIILWSKGGVLEGSDEHDVFDPDDAWYKELNGRLMNKQKQS